MKKVVCITEEEFKKARDVFEHVDDFEFVPVNSKEDVLAAAVKEENAFAVVIGVEPYRDKLYEVLHAESCIARFGVGHDGVDKLKATKAGIFVTNTPGVLDNSVAEHAIWLLGAMARQITLHDRNIREHKWNGCIGTEVAGKTLSIIGCGKIGSKVARIAKFGFGMNVIGYDVIKLDSQLMSQGFTKLTNDLDWALEQADFISLHIPSIPQTRNFVNAMFLSKVKPSACIINTARGHILDENAVYDAIVSGKLAGAGLDVFENEPYAPLDVSKDLRDLPNIVLTPHVGSSTVEACQRMGHSVIDNLRACAQKRWDDMDIVDSEILKMWQQCQGRHEVLRA